MTPRPSPHSPHSPHPPHTFPRRLAVATVAALLLAPAACERKRADPPTAETELPRRRESLMRQMDEIAAEHEEAEPAAGPATGPEATPDPATDPDAGPAEAPPGDGAAPSPAPDPAPPP